MSETNSPVGIAFDLQRNAIEQTHDAFKRGVETQHAFGRAIVDFGPATQAHERSYGTVRSAVDVYFDALESMSPAQQDLLVDFRRTVDEQLDSLEANQLEAIETIEANVKDGNESAEELLEEFVAALDEQFEAVLDGHGDVEDQTVQAFDGFEENLEELQAAFEAQSEEVSEHLAAQLEQFEAQVADAQQQVEDVTEELAETTEQQVESHVEVVGESLEAIEGIGTTYADRVREQGIDSLDALAEANADAIAEAAEVSHAQAQKWIDAAQSSV